MLSKRIILLSLLSALLISLFPAEGYAECTKPCGTEACQARYDACLISEDAQDYLDGCKSSFESWQVVTMIVACVEGTFRAALAAYLGMFLSILEPTIVTVIVLSVMLTGIKVVGGVQELNKEVLLYILKLGLVLWFIVSLQGWAMVPFEVVHYLSTLVVGGYSPWGSMDQVFCNFFGTGCTDDNQLQNGLTSLVQAAMFSGIQGLLITILSILATLTIIYFIFRAIHTYLASIALIAFVMLLSPLMIPLALFGRTSRYLFKWVDYLLAAMLHPIILFAFLFMFGGTIIAMLNWFTFDLMGGNDFSQHWRNNQSMFSWLLNADPRTVKQLEGVLGSETGRTAVHSFVSPSMLNTVETNPFSTFALDFGSNQVWAMQVMVFGFLGLFITAYLMLSMVNYLPRISEAIAGVVLGLEVQGIPFVSELKHAFHKLKGSIGGGG